LVRYAGFNNSLSSLLIEVTPEVGTLSLCALTRSYRR